MTDKHLITREIGIDAGHRVTYHGSKCRNIHGHRYTIQAECEGPLADKGAEQGMVLDFGFLKEEMMTEIDRPCDHGFVIWKDDPLLPVFMPDALKYWAQINIDLEKWGYCETLGVWDEGSSAVGKLYIVPFVPTAENLARHWFERLAGRVSYRTAGRARLVAVKVWETPNCMAEYRP